ncbi:MAG: BA14K family protein [Allorhizobium sp.]
MTRFAKITLLSVAVAAAITSIAPPAMADGYYRQRHHQRDRGGNDAAVLGLFGLAAGVAVGAAIANNSGPRYVEPDYVDPRYQRGPYLEGRVGEVDDYPPPPRARASYVLQPWTPDWYEYCANRYRSFDSQSGTYVGYDGRPHMCTAG